jgi:hypothetical protein
VKYSTAAGDQVTIQISRGGYLNDVTDTNGRGIQLTVESPVPHRTVLSGSVRKGPHGTRTAYLGYTIYGLGSFGEVTVRMHSPPFQVELYPFPTTGSRTKTLARTDSFALKAPLRIRTANATTLASRPFHAFRR